MVQIEMQDIKEKVHKVLKEYQSDDLKGLSDLFKTDRAIEILTNDKFSDGSLSVP